MHVQISILNLKIYDQSLVINLKENFKILFTNIYLTIKFNVKIFSEFPKIRSNHFLGLLHTEFQLLF